MNIDKLSIELLLALSAIILRGEIAPYASSPDLQKTLSRHRLTAWMHHEEAVSDSVPIILFEHTF